MKEVNPEEFRSLVEQGKRLEELMEIYSLNKNSIRSILMKLKLRIKRVQKPKFKISDNTPSIEDLARVTVEEVEEPWVESKEFEDWNDEDQRQYDEYNERINEKVENDPGDYSGVTDDSYYNNVSNDNDVDKDLNDMFGAHGRSDIDKEEDDTDIASHSWDF